MSVWYSIIFYTVMSEIARPDRSRIIQDKQCQSSQRLSFTGTQGKLRLFSASLTIKENTWSWAWRHKHLIPAVERQRLAELWFQGQPGLQRVWGQPGLHSETSSLKNQWQQRNHVHVSCDKTEHHYSKSQLLGGKIKIESKHQTLLSVCTRSLLCSRQISWKWMDRLEGT